MDKETASPTTTSYRNIAPVSPPQRDGSNSNGRTRSWLPRWTCLATPRKPGPGGKENGGDHLDHTQPNQSATSEPTNRPYLRREDRLIAGFLIFAFSSGILAHLWPAVKPFTRYTTDALLLLVNGWLLWHLYRTHRDVRLWYWLAGAYVFTFTAEALGVATGAIFGEYQYGRTMRWQWLGVPFVIALNWAVLTLAANDLVVRMIRGRKWAHSGWILAPVAGVVLALYDLAIEPVAIALDYWQWSAATIPVRNYLAWAVVGALISWPLHRWKIGFGSPVLLVYFFAQLVFFIALNLGL